MALAFVTEANFEKEVIRSELPVFVYFTADWCQPCKVVGPEVEALARDTEGKLKVRKVDIDKSKQLATLMRIQSVPTFVVFQKGRPVMMESGVRRKAEFLAMVDPFLPRPEGAIKPAELAPLIAQGQVVAVDVREAAAFGRAHLPRAVSFPESEIESRLAELQMLDGEPVLYCRTGERSREIADKLTASGMGVAFLEGGILAWEGSLLPIERPD
jgi:thioredoxin 1/putative thioredoxin